MENEIRFNWPYTTGNELKFITEAVNNRSLSGNGPFTKKCQNFLMDRYQFKKVFLTTSCTDALEMCAILINIEPDDEVIVPSYTFVSTALAFIRQGAKIVFADSRRDHPGIDEDKLEMLITPKTKAIVVVHYAGIACDMRKIMDVANKHNLFVVEDAAQAIDSFYKNRPLGSIGHLAAFSFHETKNISCGEGGMLVINDEQFIKRAEIIWEKGTDRAKFFRGEIDKYGWVDTGSSFLPSEILAAFLYAQLEDLEFIQSKRIEIWDQYYQKLNQVNKEFIQLPIIPVFATNNGHMFYIVCKDIDFRSGLIEVLRENRISAVFHYLSLHESEFYKEKHDGRDLVFSNVYSDRLLRLPFYLGLTEDEIERISNIIINYSNKHV